MRILKKIKGSVLWLLRSNKWAEENLCKEAKVRGVDVERIIFADNLSQGEHLSRHKHADLFIDTFNVNAHTTASDALWAGLPIVTKQGNQFAARVASSLLNAIGLNELVTTTEEAYEALILDLAQNPVRLKAIKKKLDANKAAYPLFDTERHTLHLEKAFEVVSKRHYEGIEPADIEI